MAYDAFLKIEDVNGNFVQGEVKDANHPGEIEIKDFSFGIENPTTIGSATGGAGAGKVSFNEFTISKTTDKASPVFFKNCCSGAHFKKATLTMRKAGGNQSAEIDFLKYEMSDVFISSFQWAGAEGGDDRPLEQVGLNFAKFHMYYIGDDGSTADAGWDVVRNTVDNP